jgi:prepilin-type processing-associated H-X9-DG protein
MRDLGNAPLLSTPMTLFACPSDTTRVPLRPPSGLFFRPERLATTNYCGNGGSFNSSFLAPQVILDEGLTNGVMGRDSARRFSEVTDGLSNTILAGEVIHYNFFWDPTLYGHFDPPLPGVACCTLTLVRTGASKMNPGMSAPQQQQRESFSSQHDGGAHMALCDGSVRFVSEHIDTTSRPHNAATASDPFDHVNGGADYGIWQRLFSRNDGLAVTDF